MIEMNVQVNSFHKLIVPWIVATALFMETLDITILNNAVPVIALHFNVYPLDLKLALTSYLISLDLFIPISGYLADKYGSREILLFGIFTFGVGSLFCGMSNSLLQLVLSRILQGMGGALMMPVCRLILLKSYSKSEVLSISNYATIPSLLGPAVGRVIGGVIITYFSWRWIFFVNIPFAMLLWYLTFCYTRSFKEVNLKKFDLTGFVIFSLSLLFTIFAIELMVEKIININQASIILLVSCALFLAYLYLASKKDHPFIEPLLFRSRTFVVTTLGSFVSRIGIGGIPLLIPLLLQISHDYSPLKASFYVVFYAIGMMCAKLCVKPILRRIGFRNALFYNTNLIGFTILLFVFMVENNNSALFIGIIFLNGFFTSIQFSCMNVLHV